MLAICCLANVIASGVEPGDWRFPECSRRVEITVDPMGAPRVGWVVEVDLSELRPFADSSLRAADSVTGERLESQLDGDRLIVLLPGETTTLRRAHAYFGLAEIDGEPEIEPLVSVTEGVEHEDQESFRVETQSATYYYHRFGAGFAGMEDADGIDWINYSTAPRETGEFRGIPNMGYPEGYMHPGKEISDSRITARGPLKATIRSASNDGTWAGTWEFYPRHATMTVERVSHPYWFLYEGTPGGVLQPETDFMAFSDGRRFALSERWDDTLPSPQWVYFGDGALNRVLYLARHETDDGIDSYWPMGSEPNGMTVFGFGRKGLDMYMTRTPARFTIGFAESRDHEAVKRTIESATRPYASSLSEIEIR